jgi:hypothetical protein
MFRLYATCLALALPAAATFALAGDQPPPPPAATQPATASLTVPSADEVLKQLSNGEWRQRRQAIEQLVALGPDAEPVLRELLQRELDGETRKNVELAIGRIRENRVMGPTMLTLHVKDASPAQVFANIARQCSIPVPTWPEKLWDQPGWPNLTLDFDRRPFWEVMDELSKRLQVDYLTTEPQDLRIARDSGHPSGATFLSGAFLLTADVMTFRNGMTVELSIYGEPKVVITRAISFKLDRAEDDHGNVLLPQTSRRFFGRRFRTGSRQLPMPFQRPPEEVNRIAHFQGSIKIAIQTASEIWKVADLLTMSPQTRTVDSMPITLESFGTARVGEGYELVLSVPSGWSSKGTQDELVELIRKRLQVLDAHGRKLTLGAVDPRAANDGTEITAAFSTAVADGPNTGAPASLLWDIPAHTRELVVPFDFKDIPIAEPFN